MSLRFATLVAAMVLLQACATAPQEPLLVVPEGCQAEGLLQPVPALRSTGLYAVQADLKDGRIIARQVASLETPKTNDPPAPRPSADNPFPFRGRTSSLPFRSIEQHMRTMRCPGFANLEAQVVIGPDRAGYRKVRLTPLVEGETPRRLVQPR